MGNCNDGCGCHSHSHNGKDSNGLPNIYVNGVPLDKKVLAQELQYYPAPSFQSAVQQAAQGLILRMLLREEAKSNGLDLENEEIAFDTLVKKHCVAKHITEEDCRRYYEKNPKSFTTTPFMLVRHILLSADKEDLEWRAVQKKLAEDLLKKLQESDDLEETFLSLLSYSKCPSRDDGGSLGELQVGDTVPEFERQVFALDEGLAAHPVETRYGYHIIWVEHKIPGELVPYETAKERIESYLNERASRQAVADYLVRLVNNARIDGIKIKFNNENIVLPK